jgi:hypothetical protein
MGTTNSALLSKYLSAKPLLTSFPCLPNRQVCGETKDICAHLREIYLLSTNYANNTLLRFWKFPA